MVVDEKLKSVSMIAEQIPEIKKAFNQLYVLSV